MEPRPSWNSWLKVVRSFFSVPDPPTALSSVDTRLFVELQVCNRVFNALVDTGATRSYVGPHLAAFLEAEGYSISRDNRTAVQLADGTARNTDGQVTFPASIGTRVMVGPWEYLPSLSTEAIIGLDLLVKFQFQINLANGTLQFREETIPLQGLGSVANLGGLQSLQTPQRQLPQVNPVKGPADDDVQVPASKYVIKKVITGNRRLLTVSGKSVRATMPCTALLPMPVRRHTAPDPRNTTVLALGEWRSPQTVSGGASPGPSPWKPRFRSGQRGPGIGDTAAPHRQHRRNRRP